MRCLLIASCVLLFAKTFANADQPNNWETISPAGEVEQVATGFAFTEGPASDGNGSLYFTDIPNAKILKLGTDGKVTTFTDDSRHANGLMFNTAGELLACEMDGQLVAWDVKTKQRRVLASEYAGVRFNAPNDLVIDSTGGIYFTDPRFRAPQPLPQTGQGVYYVSAEGKVSRLIDNLPAPNGIVLSLDEQMLYVLPTGSSSMKAYAVDAPGKLGEGREFCQVKQKPGQTDGGSDGGTLDEQGNVYLTTALGVQVNSPTGELLGIVELPQQPANVTFGGAEHKTLYATARTSLYAVEMKVRGHRFSRQPDAAEPALAE